MVSLQLGVGVFCSFWLGGHSRLVYSLYALRLFCLLLIYVLTYQKKIYIYIYIKVTLGE